MGSIRDFRKLDVYRMAMDEQEYEHILGKLVNMISRPEQWTIRAVREEEAEYDTERE